MRDPIKTKEIAIKYISTNKMIADPLTKPIPRDTFKSYMLSLGLRRVYFLDISCYVTEFFVMSIYLIKIEILVPKCSYFVRRIEQSQAYD